MPAKVYTFWQPAAVVVSQFKFGGVIHSAGQLHLKRRGKSPQLRNAPVERKA
jgi:hypothetical protein